MEVLIVVECGDTNSTRILQQMRRARLPRRPRLFFRYVKERKKDSRSRRHTGASSRRVTERISSGLPTEVKLCPRVLTILMEAQISASRKEPHRVLRSDELCSERRCGSLSIGYDCSASKASISETEILIVGRDPSSELVKVVQRYSEETTTGAVDDVRSYLERADVFVASLRFAFRGSTTKSSKLWLWKDLLSQHRCLLLDCAWMA